MFVFIAYQPNFFDTKTGYNISSEYISYHSLNEEDLFLHWAHFIHINVLRDNPERLYYIQVFNNSRLIWDEIEEQDADDFGILLYKKMLGVYDHIFIGS